MSGYTVCSRVLINVTVLRRALRYGKLLFTSELAEIFCDRNPDNVFVTESVSDDKLAMIKYIEKLLFVYTVGMSVVSSKRF